MKRGPVYRDQDEKNRLEFRNAYLLQLVVLRLIQKACDLSPTDPSPPLTPKLIKSLHRLAMDGIYSCAGRYRQWPVRISGAAHRPPESRYVAGLMAEMCDRVNETEDPVEASAFILWKLNWIHPFGGGNGRTSRVASYLVLCVRLRVAALPTTTIAEYVEAHRKRYEDALRDADRAWEAGSTDVSKMIAFISDMLEEGLSVFDDEIE